MICYSYSLFNRWKLNILMELDSWIVKILFIVTSIVPVYRLSRLCIPLSRTSWLRALFHESTPKRTAFQVTHIVFSSVTRWIKKQQCLMGGGTIGIAVDIAKFVHHPVRNIFMRRYLFSENIQINLHRNANLPFGKKQIRVVRLRDSPTLKFAIAELITEC